jgi:hypothetical protein
MSRLRAAAAATALLLIPATRVHAEVTWMADPSRGTSVFEGLERDPGIIDLQPDPNGLLGDVYHFNIYDNPEGGKERCEAKGTRLPDGTNVRLTDGNTYWIGWRSMYGEGVREGKAWVALFQMHAYGVTGSGAPFVLRTLSDGVLHLQNNVMGTNIHIWNVPLVTGQWQSFVLHVHMSSVATEGWVELWYNGVRQTFINGEQRYYCPTHEDAPGTYNRLKWGIYRGGGNSGNWHAWMSGARLGTSFEDVDPDNGHPPTPTPTPTASPTPNGLKYEAEQVPLVPVGAPNAIQSDSKSSGGKWMALLADGPGDYIDYTLASVPAGVYDVWLKYKSHPSRGIVTMQLDGQPIGPASLDQYSNPQAYPDVQLGTVRFEADGTHVFRQTVTGKNPLSGAYTASADLLTFVRDRVPPVVETPEDMVVEATGPDGAAVSFTVGANDDKDGDLPVTVAPSSGSMFPLGTTTVAATATDFSENTSAETFTVTVVDTTPPTLWLAGDVYAEATGPNGAAVTYAGRATDLVSGEAAVTFDPPSGSTFPLGATPVTARSVDAAGNAVSATFTVTVRDTTAPAIQQVTASPAVLWPPNHKMVPVTLKAVVRDAVDAAPSVAIIGVASNEPPDCRGDAHPAPDVQVTGPLSLLLRAERAGNGRARVYTITVQSRDAAGNASSAAVTVTVPHDRR